MIFMGLTILNQEKIISRILKKLWLSDAYRKIKRIKDLLNKGDKILDIGGGPGTVCYLLKCLGFNPVSLDIQNTSIHEDVKPIIYDGKKFPFQDKTFDVALILTVLHHTSFPEIIIEEAKRVARRIIIIEDVYNNHLQKYITYFIDSIANLQFFNHPHKNKSHKDWLKIFKRLSLKLVHHKIEHTAPFLHQATYLLEN
jgi:ubiquinone/menaquinone biosynthesis C-methylase UbiE